MYPDQSSLPGLFWVQMARSKHADQYTTFIRAGRTAKAQTYLTRKEGDETDVDLGMTPYRCVCGGGPWGNAFVVVWCSVIQGAVIV